MVEGRGFKLKLTVMQVYENASVKKTFLNRL